MIKLIANVSLIY